jgi:hypothetical protein
MTRDARARVEKLEIEVESSGKHSSKKDQIKCQKVGVPSAGTRVSPGNRVRNQVLHQLGDVLTEALAHPRNASAAAPLVLTPRAQLGLHQAKDRFLERAEFLDRDGGGIRNQTGIECIRACARARN